MDTVQTNNGKKGGLLKGKPHYDKNGKSLGGIKAVVTDAGGKPVELEGGEVIINKEASKKHWKTLSKINQSAGNGVPIGPPEGADEDPDEYKEGGKVISFNPNHIPNKWVYQYAKTIKTKHPEIWKLGGNIFGNEAFINLERVLKRGHWLDSEEWMYIKWRSYVARHKGDFRIEGVVAMLKWCDKVEKGWAYMKDLIEEKIDKIKSKSKKFSEGGGVEDKTEMTISRLKSEFRNEPQIFSGEIIKRGSSEFKIVDGILYIKRPNENWEQWRVIKFGDGGGVDSIGAASKIENFFKKLKLKPRQKELSNLYNFKFSYEDAPYIKINKLQQIKEMRDELKDLMKEHINFKYNLLLLDKKEGFDTDTYETQISPEDLKHYLDLSELPKKDRDLAKKELRTIALSAIKLSGLKKETYGYRGKTNQYYSINTLPKMETGGGVHSSGHQYSVNFKINDLIDLPNIGQCKVVEVNIKPKKTYSNPFVSISDNFKDFKIQKAFLKSTHKPESIGNKAIILTDKFNEEVILYQYKSGEKVYSNYAYTGNHYKMSNGGEVENKRDYLEHRLWNERGYEYTYLKKLNQKELRSLYDTEFYYDFEDDVERWGDGAMVKKTNIPKENTGGNCYEVAGNIAMDSKMPKSLRNKSTNFNGTPYVVHAQVTGQGAIDNVKYGHAWVEDDVFVYDFSNGRELIIPKELYYFIGQVEMKKPIYYKYPFDVAVEKMLSSKHYGPWELKTESGL